MEVINEHLKSDDLTVEQREELEIHADKLSGVLLSIWFPIGVGRKLIMFVLFSIGIYGLEIENDYLLISWILLPCFSPRIVGEVSYLIGRFVGGIRGTG